MYVVPKSKKENTADESASLARDGRGDIHKVASLFTGIGGLERGLSAHGHSTVEMCENDGIARAVLKHRFPGIPLHEDVRDLRSLHCDATLLAAGFPCQDLSQAGKTLGIGGARSGLVGEVIRLIEHHRTPWVLLENVPFMLQLGRGAAMNLLASEFERLGYKWAYRVIDARAFGLPQRRRRVYFLASLLGDPRTILFADEANQPELSSRTSGSAYGFYWTEGIRGLGWAVDAVPTLKGGSTIGIPSSPAMWLSDGSVATLDLRDAERLQGFPTDWTQPAETIAKKGSRWRLIGNAVSVPVAEWIGRRMLSPGDPLDLPESPLDQTRTWPEAACNLGDGRKRVIVSEWPENNPVQELEAFLEFSPPLLSAKATAGFLKRTERAKLRFPVGFLDALRAHLARVSNADQKTPLCNGLHENAQTTRSNGVWTVQA